LTAVTSAPAASSFSWGASPLQGEDDLFFWIEGRPKPASNSEMNMALAYRVEPAYLTAMGIPLKKGRFFTDRDNERSPRVVVIDEVLAHQYFPGEEPIGRRLHMDHDEWLIIGVVGHVKQWGLDSDDRESLRAQIYQPFTQLPGVPSTVTAVVRADGIGSTALFDSIRRVVRAHNSQNVVFRPQTMNQVIACSLAARRFSMILLDAFAAIALLLAGVGLYALISYVVGQRTHELGIRVALGARRGDVLRLVLTHGMKMALGGMLPGLIAALGLTRLIENMLYGVSSTDPATFAAISLLLMSVSLLACFVPAWRALRLETVAALRQG
jgi:predicted permease